MTKQSLTNFSADIEGHRFGGKIRTNAQQHLPKSGGSIKHCATIKVYEKLTVNRCEIATCVERNLENSIH